MSFPRLGEVDTADVLMTADGVGTRFSRSTVPSMTRS